MNNMTPNNMTPYSQSAKRIEGSHLIPGKTHVYNTQHREPSGQNSEDAEKSELHRISTYKNFPKPSAAFKHIGDIAENGFFYTKSSDKVQCFSCRRQVEEFKVVKCGEMNLANADSWHEVGCEFKNGTDKANIALRTYSSASPIAALSVVHTPPANQPAAPTDTGPAGGLLPGGASTIALELPRYPAGVPANQPAAPTNTGLTGEPLLDGACGSALGPSRQTSRVVEPKYILPFDLAPIEEDSHKTFLDSLSLNKESDRLRTFSEWKSNNNRKFGNDVNLPGVQFFWIGNKFQPSMVQPKNLAKNGFFYLGNLDRVQCFSCGGRLVNWKVEDNIETEHKTHYPNCNIVKGTDQRNVSLGAEQSESGLTTNQQSQLQRKYPCVAPISDDMKELADRLVTFGRQWPSLQVRATPYEIAEAGLFYMGREDMVACWYCDIGLKNWKFDDQPWDEHRNWRPNCEFVLRNKGEEYDRHIVDPFSNMGLRQRQHVSPSTSTGFAQDPLSSSRMMNERQEAALTGRLGDALNKVCDQGSAASLWDPTIMMLCITERYIYSAKGEVERFINTASSNDALSLLLDIGGGDFCRSASEKCTTHQNEESQPSSASAGNPASAVSSGDENMEVSQSETKLSRQALIEMERYRQELMDEKRCKICLDRVANMVFRPCNHLVACDECAKKIWNCPMCRGRITEQIRTFRS